MSEEMAAALTRFDELAETYEAWFATRLGTFVDRLESELIVALLQPNPGRTILEIGSGTGHFLRYLARAGARCVGIEPSAEMVSVAVKRSPRAIDYVRGRGESLPFKDMSFDGFLCMTTLEFVQDVDAVIKEAARVVRPGGRLVLAVLNAGGPWARARKREGGLWGQARFFRAADLEALLSPIGAIRLEYCVHVPPWAGRLPGPLLPFADWLLGRLFPGSGALIGVQVTLTGRQQ